MKQFSGLHHPSNIIHLTDECRGGFHQIGIRFSESEDKQVWGFSQKQIKQAEQTKPNPTTRKVDKWTGDWRSLQIDYHREKKLKMQVVKVPKK